MQRIKRLFDPEGLLNPGVILNDDPQAHLSTSSRCRPPTRSWTSASSAASASRSARRAGSRFSRASASRLARDRAARRRGRATPRVELRGAVRLPRDRHLRRLRLCATACPVGIETGMLIKALRGGRAGALAKGVAASGGHYGALTPACAPGWLLPTCCTAARHRAPWGALAACARLSGGRLPRGRPRCRAAGEIRAAAAPFAARRARRLLPQLRGAHHGPGARRRRARAARGHRAAAQRAGFGVVYPPGWPGCAAASRSKARGCSDAADPRRPNSKPRCARPARAGAGRSCSTPAPARTA